MISKEYPNYDYIDGEVIRKSGKVCKPTIRSNGSIVYKLRDANNKWNQVRIQTIKALTGDKLVLPESARKVLHGNGDYWIDTDGVVYSFSIRNPQGLVMKVRKGSSGYLQVQIVYKGRKHIVDVHKLMGETFIEPDYSSKGLVCMHLDNNKLNPKLSNLKLGSYSENNKAAYADGLNKGNGLKRKNPI